MANKAQLGKNIIEFESVSAILDTGGTLEIIFTDGGSTDGRLILREISIRDFSSLVPLYTGTRRSAPEPIEAGILAGTHRPVVQPGTNIVDVYDKVAFQAIIEGRPAKWETYKQAIKDQYVNGDPLTTIVY